MREKRKKNYFNRRWLIEEEEEEKNRFSISVLKIYVSGVRM